jgi:hypothetical protein
MRFTHTIRHVSLVLYIVTSRSNARQRLGNHIPAEARQRISKQAFSAIERLCFLHGLCRVSESRVEARSNTSTVALLAVRGDKNGSLESETVKYCRESHETRTRE